MNNLEKIVKGMKEFRADLKPFCGGTFDWMKFEAGLALLKELEPIAPSVLVSNGPDDICSRWYLCGKCKKPIDYKDRFCKRCGQAVEWNDID